jgi:hypothetical protein
MKKNAVCCVLWLQFLTILGCVHQPIVQEPASYPKSAISPAAKEKAAGDQKSRESRSHAEAAVEPESVPPIPERQHTLEHPVDTPEIKTGDAREQRAALDHYAAEAVSGETDELSPPEKVQQQLLLFDEGQKEWGGLDELSPAERAKRLLELEELGPMATLPSEEAESKARVQQLINVYASALGIYDEILDEVYPGVGHFARKANLPRWLTIGGEHRTRYEYMNGQFRRGLRSVDQQIAQRTRFFFAIHDILDPVRFTLELQDSRAHLTHSDSNVGTTHIDKTEIQQLHVDLVFSDFLGTGLPSEIQAGRVNMDLGRGRWIARNNFRNTTNAYDGVYWRLGDSRGFQSNTFAVWPVDKLQRALNPFFDENENFMWGSYVLLPPVEPLPWLRAELSYHGHAGSGPYRDFSMLGYRFFKNGGVNQWEFEIESDYQFGKISALANFAHFHHGELGYTFDHPWKPKLLGQFDYAAPGFDIMYGRRSFELTPTGILGPFQRNNLISSGYRLLLQPASRYWVFFQHRATWLADATAPWVGTGLRDPSGNSGSFLGHTFEIRARWQALENLFFQAGYAHFAFGSFAKNAPESPVDRNMNYGYFWTEFMF